MSDNLTDVAKILVGLGVNPKQAKTVNSVMNGIDYVNLVNALGENSPQAQRQVFDILNKYGITTKVPTMEDSRLKAIFKEMRAGADYDSASTKIRSYVRPIREHNETLALMLEASGFTDYVNVPNAKAADLLIDWLDENEFDYQADGATTFLVNVESRDELYKLNSFVGRLYGKDVFMDTAEGEEVLEAKKEKEATRNPFASQLSKKTGGGAHKSAQEKEERKDKWSRNAKHKGRAYESFSQGQSVRYGEGEYPVHVAGGPNGTLGILIDGKVKMVKESEVEQISEGVLGMTRVDPLTRLRELAGFKTEQGALNISEDEFGFDDDEIVDIDVADDVIDDTIGDVDVLDTIDDDTIDIPNPLDEPEIEIDAGMPGDLPPMNDPIPGAIDIPASVNSPAYDVILSHLSEIQSTLGDVKLSEYKSLIAKLDSITGQIRSMGRDYLGERRKK